MILSPLWSAVLFSASSIAMILCNKAAIICYREAEGLLFLQTASTLVMILFFNRKIYQNLSLSVAMKWTPCSCLFVLNLFSSLIALKYLGVHTFTLIRNVQPCLVAPLDAIIFQQWLSWSTWLYLLLILMGSVLYASQDLTFSIEGYLWGLVHIISMSVYLIRIKQLSTSHNLSSQTMSFYNNMLALPPLLCMQAINYNLSSAASSITAVDIISRYCIVSLAVSCVGGFCVSLSAFEAQKNLSATSFVTLNNVSKIPAIILGRFIFGGILSEPMIAGMCISLLGGYLYTMSLKSEAFSLRTLITGHWTRRLSLLSFAAAFQLFMFLFFIPSRIEFKKQNSQASLNIMRYDTIISSYPECNFKKSSTCRSSSYLFTCASVPGNLQFARNDNPHHKSCLNGSNSFGICTDGRFMCLCTGLGQQTETWSSPCPKTKYRSILKTASVDFSNADYRLGNILDRWFSAHFCRVTRTCTQDIASKLEEELGDLTARSPDASFGRFLSENQPHNLSSLLHIQSSSQFHKHYEWFWIYFYDAIELVLHEFRDVTSQALHSFVGAMNISVPYFNAYTCVVHYRLGDMLSHSHFLDPIDFANQLHAWSTNQSLDIHHFHILFSGNILFRANVEQAASSRELIKSFLSTLRPKFPYATVFLDEGGNPDEDWIKMAVAPMLFTSHGSYAISAAAVSYGARATPAMFNSNFPGCETGTSRFLAKDWFLFQCKNYLNPTNYVNPATRSFRKNIHTAYNGSNTSHQSRDIL
jgi:drug/metabolite transporter (DMT)-like permease